MAEDSNTYKRGLVWSLGFFTAALAVALLIYAHSIMLMFFGAVLLAIVLSWPARKLADWSGLPYSLCLVCVLLAIVGLFTGVGFLSGPHIAKQIDQLSQRLPGSFDSAVSSLKQYNWGQRMVERFSIPRFREMAGRVTGILTGGISLVLHTIALLILAIYLSLSTSSYHANAMKLVPDRAQDRTEEVLQTVKEALRWWFAGRLVSMIVVGILTGVGLWIMGVPLAFTLGVLAFILSFVPFLGPLVALVPAVLMGLSNGPITALYVALLYLGVQLVESYLITPLVQKRAVSIPPGLLIAGQLLMGFLGGILGILLATPLIVFFTILVQMLYVDDVVGHEAPPLGKKN